MSWHQKLMVMLAIHFSIFMFAIITEFSWWYLLFGYVFSKVFNILGFEIGLHRLWSHKSFTTKPWKEYLLHVFAFPLLYGSSIVFSGVHRQHHAYSDTKKDPHIVTPRWKSIFYIREKGFKIESKFVSDLIHSPTHKWIHRHYFPLNVLLLVLFLALFGPVITGWFLSFMVIYNFVSAALFNILTHVPELGTRTFDTKDNSTNNWFVQLITWSEGLHNHHHYDSKKWDFRVNKGDIDIPALFIKYLFKDDQINNQSTNRV